MKELSPVPWQIGKHDGKIVDVNGFYADKPQDKTLQAIAPELLMAMENVVTEIEGFLPEDRTTLDNRILKTFKPLIVKATKGK
jgi:hypothetical protein